MSHEAASPLRLRLTSPNERLRVLLLTNEVVEGDAPGLRDGFARLHAGGDIDTFDAAIPKLMADTRGEDVALRDILELMRAKQPNVVVQVTNAEIEYTRDWFRAIAELTPRPLLLFWEGDAWNRWGKRPPRATRLWWEASDAVFTVAIGKQRTLIESLGGSSVRFVPTTYDHILFADIEGVEPPTRGDYSNVAVIGNAWGNGRLPARLPGARQRFRLVRSLQRDASIPLAVYGLNWSGRGVEGPIPRVEQAAVARRSLLTANWDHFPDYAASTSDRLPIQLLAGRVHVTTLHPQSDWLPGPEVGLFREPTVSAVVDRVRRLLERPREEVLELGLEAHRWVRHRLSDRELARFMLGSVDERLLQQLPSDPWEKLPS